MELYELKKLRQELIDYYGSGMFNGYMEALFKLNEIEKCSDEELILFAKKNGFNTDKYVLEKKYNG